MATLTHIDTACTLLDIGGWRIVTDPAFDPPGRRYWFGWGSSSRKTGTPAMSPDEVGPVDAVLLSHEQHGDNLDIAGRAFAERAPLVLTTPEGSRRIPSARAMVPWARETLTADGREDLHVTAVPARHRPAWIPPFVSGPATGFILESSSLPRGALYVTGDTRLFAGVRETAHRFPIDILVVHVGAVRFPYLSGPARFTFDAAEAAEVAGITGARLVIPVHTGGWTHFREGPGAIEPALARLGLADRLRIPVPGRPLDLG